MFKVEVETKGSTPDKVIFTCLASASHHENGVLFNVGRKNADIVFENERSVSRSHCSLRLVKIPPRSKKTSDTGNSYGNAEGDEQIEACENALDGVAVVLDDLGSKFGSSAIFEKEAEDKVTTPSIDDSETDDGDETDDEGIAPGGPASSQVTNSVQFQNPNEIHKNIEKNQSIVLTVLSIRENKKRDGSVRVRVGSAFFKITRIPIQFCLSRLSTKQKKEWEVLGPKVGAEITTIFDCDTIKYLVAPDKSTTAKAISAWALNVPLITPDYISVLAARTNAEDPIPNVEDYESPPTELMIENDAVPAKRRVLLEGYKVLSMMASEGEILCRCTGGTIVPLYTEGGNEKADMKLWQNDEFWTDLENQQKLDKLVVVWLDSSSKRKKKHKDYLIKKMKQLREANESKFTLSCIDQKSCANAISFGKILRDVDDIELVPLRDSVDDRGSSRSESNLVPENGKENEDTTELNPTVEESFQEDEEQITNTKQSIDHVGDSREEAIKDSEIKAGSVDLGGTESIKDSVDVGTVLESQSKSSGTEPLSKRDRKKKKNSDESGWIGSKSSKEKARETENNSQKTSWISSSRSKPREDEVKAVIVDDEVHAENEMDESHAHDKPSYVKKQKLKKTDDGWMVCCPQGKKRSKFKRSRAELSEMGEVEFSDPAPTDFCGGLIVRTKADLDKVGVNAVANSDSRPNFKKFRKNSVITGMHSLSKIRFMSVLPKESERERELQAMHSKMERDQRESDLLFDGNEGGKKGKNIRNYFTASTKKSTPRGRTARRRKN